MTPIFESIICVQHEQTSDFRNPKAGASLFWSSSTAGASVYPVHPDSIGKQELSRTPSRAFHAIVNLVTATRSNDTHTTQ